MQEFLSCSFKTLVSVYEVLKFYKNNFLKMNLKIDTLALVKRN